MADVERGDDAQRKELYEASHETVQGYDVVGTTAGASWLEWETEVPIPDFVLDQMSLDWIPAALDHPFYAPWPVAAFVPDRLVVPLEDGDFATLRTQFATEDGVELTQLPALVALRDASGLEVERLRAQFVDVVSRIRRVLAPVAFEAAVYRITGGDYVLPVQARDHVRHVLALEVDYVAADFEGESGAEPGVVSEEAERVADVTDSLRVGGAWAAVCDLGGVEPVDDIADELDAILKGVRTWGSPPVQVVATAARGGVSFYVSRAKEILTLAAQADRRRRVCEGFVWAAVHEQPAPTTRSVEAIEALRDTVYKLTDQEEVYKFARDLRAKYTAEGLAGDKLTDRVFEEYNRIADSIGMGSKGGRVTSAESLRKLSYKQVGREGEERRS